MQTYNIIKKITTWLLYFIVIITGFIFFSYRILHLNVVQNYLCKKLTIYFSGVLHAKVEIGGVDYSFFDNLILEKVHLEDQNKGSLLYIDKLLVNFDKIDFKKKLVSFDRISIDMPDINISQNKDLEYNYQFLFDYLSDNKDTSKSEWKVICKEINLYNAKINYKEYCEDFSENIDKLDFKNIVITQLNLNVRDFYYCSDSINLIVDNMDATERCGLKIESFYSDVLITNKSLSFNNLKIYTPKSKINALYYSMNFNDFSDFKYFNDKIKLNTSISSSVFNFNDLRYFDNSFANIDKSLYFRGKVSGKISRIKAKEIQLYFGDNTRITGDISINGLPDYESSFFHANLKLVTANNDLEMIPVPPFENNNHLKLPEEIKKFGLIKYTGKLTGFYRDFVAYGNFITALGSVTTDISCKIDNQDNIKFIGKISGNHFKIGHLIDAEEDIRDFSINAQVEVETNKTFNDYTANMIGKIMNITILNYDYKNIDIDGKIKNKEFNGNLTVKDPNIDLIFNGNVDFNESTPVFNFTADFKKLKLAPLNLPSFDSLSTVSFYTTAKFNGGDIDNIYGSADLTNFHYTGIDKSVKSKKMILSSVMENQIRKINFSSDFLDAEIKGDFIPSELYSITINQLIKYIPSLKVKFNNNEINNTKSKNIDLKLVTHKNINQFLSLADDSLYLADNTLINAKYSTGNNTIITGVSDSLQYGDFKAYPVNLDIKADDTIETKIFTNNFKISNQFYFKNVICQTYINDDKIENSLIWNNNDTINEYSGEIYTDIETENIDSSLQIKIRFTPSMFVINNNFWYINDGFVLVDTNHIKVQEFILNHENQYFYSDGIISHNPEDTLNIIINNVQLADFNYLLAKYNIEIQGVLKGNAKLSNILADLKAESDFDIDNLLLNKESIGHVIAKTKWINGDKRININASTQRGNIKTITLNGNYYVNNNNIDALINIDKFRLDVLNPFVSGLISDVKGIANGKISVSGKLDKPVVDGNIFLQKTAFTIDYLNTRYNFTHNIHITNNIIEYDSLYVYDDFGNYSISNAKISHELFRKFVFNINFECDKFHLLNTKEIDNELFYGQAFGTGIFNITGTPENIHFKANIKADKIHDKIHKKNINTKIMIPLNNPEELSDNNFVKFVTINELIKEKPDYKVDLTGLTMDLNFEVDPETEIQLIFDSKVGDVIRARGNADLFMEINTKGDFNIYGEYVIEEGDYLFTLQNVINKKFKLEKGSSIKWNGDPYQGYMNVEAIYRLKTSLKTLTMDTTQTQRVPVECKLKMTEDLLTPDINFEIKIPSGSDDINSLLSKMSEDELNKQVLSLLILNRFYTSPSISGNYGYNQSAEQSTGAVGVTSSELLSNQLSHWLSQISNDFDIGINYRPGDEISSEQLEVALSTQLLNDRVEINGNLGVSDQNNNTSGLIGDVVIEVKLDKSGKLRAKGFNKSNHNILYEESPYKQGIGASYKQEFNKLSDIWRKRKEKQEKTQ
ncbi:MAG: translocation/assembly module TamB domain-containing protein [Marinilabiliales bacterium]